VIGLNHTFSASAAIAAAGRNVHAVGVGGKPEAAPYDVLTIEADRSAVA
jgi:hypothetical protein